MANLSEFSKQAAQYAQFRPSYPDELFKYLATISPSCQLAFDVGTGNGQCAVNLSSLFEQVVASDLSSEQIAHAVPRNNIRYFVAPAEKSGLADQSVDLITVATALHWFNRDAFYQEVHRILKPDGLIAAWAYDWHTCEETRISEILIEIGKGTLKTYWSAPPQLIWSGYRTIEFPFTEISAPTFELKVDWNLYEFIGYIGTWSASQKFIDDKGYHPVKEYFDELLALWKTAEKKLHFKSKLHLRIGRRSP